VGLVVDGQIVNVAVGNPTSTSLKSVIDDIAAAIQTQVQATDATATVSASIVGDQLRFTVAGAGANHDILFGGAGDTSNALSLFGVAGQHLGNFGLGTTTITGSSRLGVTRAAGTLDSAGLTGLASTPTGVLTINGVAITYNSTVDSLNTVLTRINNAQAGVVASVDRTNDTIVIAAKTAGPTPISIVDSSGTLGAALKLAPGTTNAQVIGQSAQVTVDGRAVTSVTNTVTNAIDGVTLTLLDQSTTTAALTVGVNNDAIQKSLSDLVASYNALADTLDKLASNAPGASTGALQGDATVRGLALGLRSLFMTPGAGLSGSLVSLGDLGVNSGVVGSKAGTTKRLNVDAAKLTLALASDPTRVAYLLSSTGGILGPIQDRIKALTQTNGLIDAGTSGSDAELRSNANAQLRQQAKIDLRQTLLDAKFAALEATLAQLQTQSSQLTQQVNAFNSSTSG
jgi:flagellar hook-associated protein 2